MNTIKMKSQLTYSSKNKIKVISLKTQKTRLLDAINDSSLLYTKEIYALQYFTLQTLTNEIKNRITQNKRKGLILNKQIEQINKEIEIEFHLNRLNDTNKEQVADICNIQDRTPFNYDEWKQTNKFKESGEKMHEILKATGRLYG